MHHKPGEGKGGEPCPTIGCSQNSTTIFRILNDIQVNVFSILNSTVNRSKGTSLIANSLVTRYTIYCCGKVMTLITYLNESHRDDNYNSLVQRQSTGLTKAVVYTRQVVSIPQLCWGHRRTDSSPRWPEQTSTRALSLGLWTVFKMTALNNCRASLLESIHLV